jgi:hypothetical protein
MLWLTRAVKTSSAEVSGAINSMYRWYAEAQVCYAYLADVPSYMDLPSQSCFDNVRWFTEWNIDDAQEDNIKQDLCKKTPPYICISFGKVLLEAPSPPPPRVYPNATSVIPRQKL